MGQVEASLGIANRRARSHIVVGSDDDTSQLNSCQPQDTDHNRQNIGKERFCGPTLRLAIILSLVWVLVGILTYRGQRWGERREPYTLVETFYVMAQILTTVGYGDYVPVKDSGFLFTAVYVLMATMATTSACAAIVEKADFSKFKILEEALIRDRLAKSSNALAEVAFRGMVSDDIDETRKTWLQNAIVAIKNFPQYLRENPGHEKFLHAFLRWSIFVLAGIIFFCCWPGEGKDLAEAFYMSVMTLTTVGFGDVTPKTPGGQIFATIWMVLGTVAFAHMVANFSAAFLARKSLSRLSRNDLRQILEDEMFQKCHPNVDRPKISRADFILFVMRDIGALDMQMVDELSKNFDELDEEQTGFLEPDRLGHFKRILSGSLPGVDYQPRVGRYHTYT